MWEHRDRLETHRLPPYEPEINPDEYGWDILRYRRLAHVFPTIVEEMATAVHRKLRRMKRHPDGVCSGI